MCKQVVALAGAHPAVMTKVTGLCGVEPFDPYTAIWLPAQLPVAATKELT